MITETHKNPQDEMMLFLHRDKNQRQAGMPVLKNKRSGRPTMQSTICSSTRFLRMILSLAVWVEREPLERTTPAVPRDERWATMCWSQAKLALLAGGIPYSQRVSSLNRFPFQSLSLKGGLAKMVSAFNWGWASFKKLPSLFHLIFAALMPRMARFMRQRR